MENGSSFKIGLPVLLLVEEVPKLSTENANLLLLQKDYLVLEKKLKPKNVMLNHALMMEKKNLKKKWILKLKLWKFLKDHKDMKLVSLKREISMLLEMILSNLLDPLEFQPELF